ncbi:pilus assembly PilX family protein [Microbulbifer sp. YPW16]|uniref:pilus assembly PilX family protein n=1 Tax=Microbulbifer sp. YPW16 TaxID=2904242 RepID=UPI001E4083D6|nr:PilX N-terminal domain-containing pilus assembly protein [Microbulbifer sp. YPW16]UHQ54550.1 PilX N-terminal domain-containing pilus assembly protein [Microbulbifer sp. YPW16]
MKRHNRGALPRARKLSSQRGAVLIVGLVMLLLMTVVAMAAMRGSEMQELMAGNMRDRNLAFQAAEAGLREAEEVLNQAVLPSFDGGVAGYYVEIDGSRNTGYWNTHDWDVDAVETDLELDRVAAPPRYVIEEITATAATGTDGGAIDFQSTLNQEEIVYYRVTSRGVGGTANAVVIIQSTFKR